MSDNTAETTPKTLDELAAIAAEDPRFGGPLAFSVVKGRGHGETNQETAATMGEVAKDEVGSLIYLLKKILGIRSPK